MPQEDQYPWNVLEIEATDDKKTIKKAYAALIKQYKPDENPEKFQEIQEAYKYALSLLQTTLVQPNNNLKIDITDNISHETILKEGEIDRNEIEMSKKILKGIEDVAHSANSQSINNWYFIKSYRSIYDINLKQQTAIEAFRLVATIRQHDINKKVQARIPIRVLKYMNDIFDWSEQWQKYQTIFSQTEIESVLVQTMSDEPAFLIDKIDIEGWFKCVATDITSSLVISYFWMFFSGGPAGFEFVKHAFYIFVGQRLVFELLFQASLGKLSHDAFIVNHEKQSASVLQIILKHLIINMTLFPIYAYFFERFLNYKILVFDQYINYTIWLSAFAFIIALNLISLLFYKKFLHEVIAKITTLHKYPEEKPIFDN